jgi:hypothetical protein
MTTNPNPQIKLDWSRLLGFDQAAAGPKDGPVQLADPRLVRLGAKFGNKPGLRIAV